MTEQIRITMVAAPNQDPETRLAPTPRPAPDRVLVRMRAAALNFADLLKAQGRYQERADFPFIPGLEGSGEVISAPRGSHLAQGQRVAVLWPGSMALIVAVPEMACLAIPDRLSH